MTLSETKKLSQHICRLLKVQEITYPIGRTSKGNLGVTFNVNNEEFDLMLDSVPLSTKNLLEDENNIELKRMVEKYLFNEEKNTVMFNSSLNSSLGKASSFTDSAFGEAKSSVSPEKKKGGRPKGSKNHGKKAE